MIDRDTLVREMAWVYLDKGSRRAAVEIAMRHIEAARVEALAECYAMIEKTWPEAHDLLDAIRALISAAAPDADAEVEVSQRMFGRLHEKPCKRPHTLTCAFSKCQAANECQAPDADGGGA